MKMINRTLTLENEGHQYTFLATGDIFTFTKDGFLMNQFRGNAKDGSVNNIWLRIRSDESFVSYPLLGIRSQSFLSIGRDCLRYAGQAQDIRYEVFFRPFGNKWFWTVALMGKNEEVDLIYGQDLGVGCEGSVYTNELYTSQYLGHSVYQSAEGYIVCSRQNMPNNGFFPFVQQGSIGAKAIHYSTDGLQFFGLSAKETGRPQALSGDLEDANLQYEFAYTALQTEPLILDGRKEVTFYGLFLPDHPDAVRSPVDPEEIHCAYRALPAPAEWKPLPPVRMSQLYGKPYSSPSFTPEEISALFPSRRLEEKCGGGSLHSFFTSDHAHVVTKEKELICRRPHGTIIITPPDEKEISGALISSTQYMYGIFNSHVVTGNTDLHKFLSTPRGFLNLQRNSGQRLYIRLDGVYRLLSLPGLFEMGMNYSRWYYKLPDDLLTVTAYTAADTPDLVLEAVGQNGKPYDFLITCQLTMGPNEFDRKIEPETIPDGLRFMLDGQTYPGLHYDLLLPGQHFTASDDRIFFEDGLSFDETFLTLETEGVSSVKLLIRGRSGKDNGVLRSDYRFEEEKAKGLRYYETLLRQFKLEGSSQAQQVAIMNETAWWYAHNAMIHYAMPHGLEQPGGAAWGTRDICQGPAEFFLATQHYELLRNVLVNIFSHQDIETGEWPQWFMFDRYSMNAGECHGDVIFWPLKCTADYLEATGDTSILEELLPYDGVSERQETLLAHLNRAFDNIRTTRMIDNTGLITYAGGDWDDTLQPASPELKQRLVSTWTVALAYQTFTALSAVLPPAAGQLINKMLSLAGRIRQSFETLLTQYGVTAGFLEHGETDRLLLHPADDTTGIHYRLLPLTRSIIAGLASPELAAENTRLIQDHLQCPDGVRLMDRPAGYDGGVSHLFRRAEQAANVGREISLQYTHAHIRYIEAMSKLGKTEACWKGLFTVNPILIQDTVPNAGVRQSNMYFSSSDGAYQDRYEYARSFDLLRTGSIEVNGGWRLYSSGPGIYLKQLIGNVLGIRFRWDGLILDPVLPQMLDGLRFTCQCFNRLLHFCYHLNGNQALRAECGGHVLPVSALSNPYRPGGILIGRETLAECCDTIDIYL